MNRNDRKLIFGLCFVVLIVLIILFILDQSGKKVAVVYYENKVIQEIDLDSDETKQYVVKGYNGDVVIETQKDKVRVVQENSPRNLCSKQGFISSTYESIVCLPNKIIIQIKSKDELDTVVR